MSTEPYCLDDGTKKGTSSGIRAFGVAVVLFTVLFTLLYSPVIFSGHLICPEIQSISVLYGDKALWTPYIYSGMPFQSNPGAQFYYPLMWLFYFMPGSWNAYVIISYVLCGAFFFSYVRLLTNSNFASFMAALAFAFGHLTSEVMNIHMLHCSIWLTAGVLALELLARRSDAATFLLGSLAVALAGLAGHPQIFAYALALWTAYALARTSMLDKQQRRCFAGLALSMITLGTLIAGVQLFQILDMADASARAKFSFDDFLTYSVHPLQVVGVFMPYIFGGAPDGIISQPHFGNFLTRNQAVYYGFIVTFLSLSVTFAFFKKRMILFWASIGLITFLLSFGNATPLAWILYHIPPFGKFRALYRILILSSFANAVLAGLCIATMERRKLPQVVLIRVIIVLGSTFAALVALIPSLAEPLQAQALKYGIKTLGLLPWTNPSIGIPCLLIVTSALACFFFERRPSLAARFAVCLVLVFDLGLTSWYSLDARWRLEAPSSENLKVPLTAKKYVPLANADYNRILTVRGGSGSYDELKPNLSQMWHVPTASGYGPLIPTRYGELLNMTEGGFLIPPWHYKGYDRCFDILSIKYAMADNGDNRLESIGGPQGPNWRKLEELGTASVHENLRVLPRTWIVKRVLKLPPAEIYSAIKTSEFSDHVPFDPLQAALVEEMPPGFETAGTSVHSLEKIEKIEPSHAKIISFSETLIKVDAQTPSPSFLILSDSYFPGWKARVDGKYTPVIRTDYIIKGIALPPGKHLVEFEYWPPYLYFSASTAALSMIAVLTIAFFTNRKKAS